MGKTENDRKEIVHGELAAGTSPSISENNVLTRHQQGANAGAIYTMTQSDATTVKLVRGHSTNVATARHEASSIDEARHPKLSRIRLSGYGPEESRRYVRL